MAIFTDINSEDFEVLDTDYNAIENSLNNILLTEIGEVPGEPSFGSHIRRHLFSNISPFTARSLEKEVKTALDNWEKRITVESVSVIQDPDYNRINIKIFFQLNSDALGSSQSAIISIT